MSFVNASACGLVAWGCAERAVGATSQALFNPDHLWVWWVPTVIWLLYAFVNLVRA